MPTRRSSWSYRPLAAMPAAREISVRSADGTRLHVEVFGPRNGYPVVLSHGITCAIPVWTHQITDLACDHRVIAFDHRGHGRSEVPRRRGYTLDHLAADLDAVLDATLDHGERAVIAGHSMGGIAITSWAQRYPDAVARRADAVALINTSTGDVLKELQLVQVPAALAGPRVLVAQGVIRAIGSRPVPRTARWTGRWLVAAMAVGADAHPSVADFVYDLFAATSPAARGRCVQMIVDGLGPQHLTLVELTVPTLVIGSTRDRLLPIGQSRRIAEAAPNLVDFVELPGGHCSILERPEEVNRRLRDLVAGVAVSRRATS